MVGTPTYYTGEDATIFLGSGGVANKLSHTVMAISDFSLTLSKDTAEQELVGEKGNYFVAGSMTAEGSLTACKLYTTAVGKIVNNMIVGAPFSVSGNCGSQGLHFYFKSCQVTGFDFSIGTASDITEGSLDFTLLYPYKVSTTTKLGTGTYIKDHI
jgi:hypothetical protein